MAQEAPPAEGATPDAPAPTADAPPQGEPKAFDAEYVKTLRGENAQWRIKAQQAEERAQELEDAQKSELEKAQTKAQREAERAAEAQAKLLRFEVAAEKQVPAEALDLLTGTTRDELEAKADKLLELVKSKAQAAQDFDGGAREPAPEPKTPEAAHNDFLLKVFGSPQQT
jgi:hypothetical protein